MAAIGLHYVAKEVVEHEGRGLDIVGGEDEQAGTGGEDLTAKIEKFRQLAFNFPDVAVGAAAEGGRVKENAVIAGAALDFAANIFHGIFDNPANGFLVKVGGGLILAGPSDGGFGSIHVGGLPSGFGGHKGGGSGIAKEIEQACAGSCHLANGLPVRRLFGEEAQVLACVGNAGAEREAAFVQIPRAGAAGLQLPAGIFVMDGPGPVPVAFGQCGLPPRLGFAADQSDGAETFKFAPVAGVEEFVGRDST